MTVNDTELDTDDVELTEYTSESSSTEQATERRSATAPGAATGRRKQAIARVRIVPGTGEWKINGRSLPQYFPNKVH
ncbi:MAG: 30S ribosomal protein S9, partial [Ornithinimicrobium sp.]